MKKIIFVGVLVALIAVAASSLVGNHSTPKQADLWPPTPSATTVANG